MRSLVDRRPKIGLILSSPMLFQSAPFICDISPASVFYPAPIKIPHGVVEIEHTALFTLTSSPLHSILLKNLFIFYFYFTTKSWIINWTTWFGLELQGTTGSVEYNSTLSSVAPLHLRFIVVMEPCFKMSKHGAEITHNATWFVWSEIRVYCASLYDFTRSSLWSHKTLYKTCFFLMQSLSWRPANRRVWIKIRGVVL